MNKHRHLSLVVGFLMMTATAAARQSGAAAGQSNTTASPSNTTKSPISTPGSPFNTTGSPFSTPNGPSNTPVSPFGTTSSPVNPGQVKTVQPGQPVERQLSTEQKFREWALNGNVPDDIKRIKVCRVETVCKMRFKDGQMTRMRV